MHFSIDSREMVRNDSIVMKHNTTKEKAPKSEQVTTRLKPETLNFFLGWAEREQRSISQVLRIALERYRQLELGNV